MGLGKTLIGFKNFVKGIFSEPDGTPSSTRVLMFVFSMFSVWLLWRIFWHLFHLTDTTQLTIWLSNIPLLITALMGLIALPYTINRGAGALTETFSGLANMMAASKQLQMNATLDGKIVDSIKKVQGVTATPAPQAPAAPAACGTTGPKG